MSKIFNKNYHNSYDSFRRLGFRHKAFEKGEIIVFNNPLHLSELMIKRIVATPGDSIKITSSIIKINNKEYAPLYLKNKKYSSKKDTEEEQLIQSLTSDLKKDQRLTIYPNDILFLNEKLVEQNVFIPKKGATIKLTPTNFNLYKRIINDYEKGNFVLVNDKVFRNGKQVYKYTFKENYYFVLGDNIENSADSRVKGFIPEFNIVGTTILIL